MRSAVSVEAARSTECDGLWPESLEVETIERPVTGSRLAAASHRKNSSWTLPGWRKVSIAFVV
jgi:hypothetical protein